MKKSIIYSFLCGLIVAVLFIIGAFYLIKYKKNVDTTVPEQHATDNDNSKERLSLCEVEDTRKLINELIQDKISKESEYLSNYYHKYPNFIVYVSIIHNDVTTIESSEKYAKCQASLLINTDYDKDNPLKLDFYKYTIRLSDNMQSINIQDDTDYAEFGRQYDKIKKWILYISK